MIAHEYAHILPSDASLQMQSPPALEPNFTEKVWPFSFSS